MWPWPLTSWPRSLSFYLIAPWTTCVNLQRNRFVRFQINLLTNLVTTNERTDERSGSGRKHASGQSRLAQASLYPSHFITRDCLAILITNYTISSIVNTSIIIADGRLALCACMVRSSQVVSAFVHVAQGKSDGRVWEAACRQHGEEISGPQAARSRSASLARRRGIRSTG